MTDNGKGSACKIERYSLFCHYMFISKEKDTNKYLIEVDWYYQFE